MSWIGWAVLLPMVAMALITENCPDGLLSKAIETALEFIHVNRDMEDEI
ncbi:MAG: hypothetical protein IKV80_08465 [Bacteroidales bacterium]|nr:hypothetical protein [Bacteroidales bacterium]